MKRLILLVTFCALSSVSFSQTKAELLAQLKSVTIDTARVNILIALTEICEVDEISKFADDGIATCDANISEKKFPTVFKRKKIPLLINKAFQYLEVGDPKRAREIYADAYALAEEIQDESQMAQALNNIALTYQNQGSIADAITYYERSLSLRKSMNDKKGMAQIYNNLGVSCQNLGSLSRAIDYYLKAMSIREELKDQKGLAAGYNNLGLLFLKQGDLKKAMEYHQKSLNIREALKDEKAIAESLHNLALVYCQQRDYVSAQALLEKALVKFSSQNYAAGIASAYSNLGRIFTESGKTKEAIDYFQQSLEILDKNGDQRGQSFALNSMAHLEMNLGNIQKALLHARQALHISETMGYTEHIMNASNCLAQIYQRMGNYKDAYDMHVLFKQMSDSLSGESNRKAALQKEFQYLSDKRAAADSVKAAEAEKVFTATLSQERTQKYALYGGIGLVLLFSGFLWSRYRIIRSQKKTIESQKLMVDEAYHKLHERNKEVMDSIRYAKRIQQSLLTNHQYIERQLDRLRKN